MRLAQKIAMWGPSNGTPYKSQLDYIVNPNGAYIDTGIKLKSTDIVRLDMFVEVFSQSGVFGARVSVAQLNYSGGLASTVAFVDCRNSSTETRASVSGSPTGRMQIYCDYDKRTVTLVDGTQWKNTSDVTEAFECADTCLLFGVNGNPHTAERFKGRIYSFSIERDGVLIADYIPVVDRYGRAMMYDRATQSYPQHHGNFEASWTNPYVQEGLMAMWDGIRNAGGSRNDALTIWSDCVGGRVLERSYTGTEGSWGWEADGLFLSKSIFSRVCTDLDVSAPFTVEFGFRTEGLSPYNFLWSITHLDDRYHRYAGITTFGSDYNIVFNNTDGNGRKSLGIPYAESGEYRFSCGYDNSVEPASAFARLNDGSDIPATAGDLALPTSEQSIMISVGGAGLNGDPVSNLTVLFLRIYSRVLSDSEMDANAEVDKTRFNLL